MTNATQALEPPAMLDRYLRITRPMHAPASMAKHYQDTIEYQLKMWLWYHGINEPVPVSYIYSMYKTAEQCVKGGQLHIVYDQYGGQFLNMCNRLYLYAPNADDSFNYFKKVIAEECKLVGMHFEYAFMMREYMKSRSEIHSTNGRGRHFALTEVQEQFCLYHETFHGAARLWPAKIERYFQSAKAWVEDEFDIYARGFAAKKATPESLFEKISRKHLEFQDRFFGTHEDREALAPFIKPLSNRDLNLLYEEVAADLFAFRGVFTTVMARAEHMPTDPRLVGNRSAYIRDCIIAVQLIAMNLRSLTMIRTRLAGEEQLERISDIAIPSAVRSGVLHQVLRSVLEEHVSEKVLEYGVLRELIPGLERSTGVSRTSLMFMNVQKRQYEMIDNPIAALLEIICDPDDENKALMDDFRATADKRFESRYEMMGDMAWIRANGVDLV